MPVMLANGSTVAMKLLDANPSVYDKLHENVSILRKALDPITSIIIPSAPESPLVHVQIKSKRDDMDASAQKELLTKIERLALNQGVWITQTPHLPSIRLQLDQGPWARPSLRIAVTSALSVGEMAQAADIVRASIVSVVGP